MQPLHRPLFLSLRFIPAHLLFLCRHHILIWKQLFSLPHIALVCSPCIYFSSHVGWLDQPGFLVSCHEADSPKHCSAPALSLWPDSIARQSPVQAGTCRHRCLQLRTGQSSLCQHGSLLLLPPPSSQPVAVRGLQGDTGIGGTRDRHIPITRTLLARSRGFCPKHPC